ncbi:hypothetical protein DTL21_27580 [Bremerella cremea]|uniref:PEP-CTERM protein-sorting domain-containing protein n=2 Tax=Pirellulales TaxID=2691354 RepID=A0A2S8FCB9_9BACT|nr:hypothetical protein C5Y83_27535 [Blastopirellula marina]RCS43100.1 hypothetical protein DTL21_27580 [Bremerella cremea]
MAIYSAVAFVAAVLSPLSVEAGFLPGFSGNSVMGMPGASGDATVSFSVYETTDSDWTNDFGVPFQSAITALGGTSLVSDASYVFFYQVVNTNPNPSANDPLSNFRVSSASEFNSFGTVNGFVFNDADGAVGPTTNPSLGSSASPIDMVLDGVPSESGVVPSGSGFAANGSAVGAPGITASYLSSVDELRFTLPSVAPNAYTSILFATVSGNFTIPPVVYGKGMSLDGVATYGDIPTPTPVPAGLALLFTGLPGVLGMFFWRRKQAVAA